MLAWTPNAKEGSATTVVDFCYYTSLRTKKYYQHHDGLDAALEAADNFVMKCVLNKANYISHEVIHNSDRQHVLVKAVEKL